MTNINENTDDNEARLDDMLMMKCFGYNDAIQGLKVLVEYLQDSEMQGYVVYNTLLKLRRILGELESMNTIVIRGKV